MNLHIFKYIVTLIIIISLSGCNEKKKSTPLIAITQIASHPALDEVRNGIVKGLSESGYKDGENIEIVFRNANGDPSLTQNIVESFVRQKATVIVPISTPSALSASKATSSIPIIFSGVTDPVGVGLLRNLYAPEGNITGVSDKWPFKTQVQTFLSFFPEHRKIGMLYTKGDDVSKIGVEGLKALSENLGFELILQPISSPSDIYPTAISLLKRVDVIYTGMDHLLLENMAPLIKAVKESGKIVFGGESGSVEKGAIFALTINMEDFGKETSKLIVQVLEGAEIKDIPVKTITEGDLLVNKKEADSYPNFDFKKADSINAIYFKN